MTMLMYGVVSDDDVDVWCLMTMLMYGVVSDDDVDVWCGV